MLQVYSFPGGFMKKRTAWLFSVFLAAALISLLFIWLKLRETGIRDSGNYATYNRHYVMITAGEDSDFWDKVYESALAEGKERSVYVERFGENLAVNYGRNDLLKMAVQAAVDGIIVIGDEEEETVSLINEAVDAGIPVVTALRDSTGSRRQCFVGTNSYNIGQEYGAQILELLSMDQDDEESKPEEARVLALVDESRMDTSQNLILLGIRETLESMLGADYPVTVETTPVDNTRNFSSEESIRDIFLDTEELPDIMICLNEVYTRCAYQAAVDYNKVGAVQLLGYSCPSGYYDSDTILNAVAKNIIYSTIGLDTDQMGRACVQALDEYVETGYTNAYTAVDTRLIQAKEAQVLTAEE